MSQHYNMALHIEQCCSAIWDSFRELQVEGVVMDGDFEITDAPVNFSHPPRTFQADFKPLGDMLERRFDQTQYIYRSEVFEILIASLIHWYIPNWKDRTFYFVWRSAPKSYNVNDWSIEFRDDEDLETEPFLIVTKHMLRHHND